MHDELAPVAEAVRKINDALGAFLPLLARAEHLDPHEREILGCLLLRTRTMFLHLDESRDIRFDTARMAWAARTLLELSVWATYSTTSTENANRLYQDHALDLKEFLDATVGLGKEFTPGDPNLGELQSRRPRVVSFVEDVGLTAEDKRLQLREIAEQIGRLNFFERFNKVLSKLMHATGLSILFPMTLTLDEGVRIWLFEFGVKTADETLRTLVNRLAALGVDVDMLQAA